jgi:hypothetical protein
MYRSIAVVSHDRTQVPPVAMRSVHCTRQCAQTCHHVASSSAAMLCIAELYR